MENKLTGHIKHQLTKSEENGHTHIGRLGMDQTKWDGIKLGAFKNSGYGIGTVFKSGICKYQEKRVGKVGMVYSGNVPTGRKTKGNYDHPIGFKDFGYGRGGLFGNWGHPQRIGMFGGSGKK